MKTFLNALKGFSKGPAQLRPNPVRDWHILLVASAVLLAGSIGWNAWFFGHVVDEGIEVADTVGGTLDGYQAGAVKEIFEMRATTSAAYRQLYPFIDPSR